MTWFFEHPTPVGPMTLTKENDALTAAYLDNLVPSFDARRDQGVFADEIRQLDEYFAGERTRFDLRLAPRGTPFQQRVWRALVAIPFGRTASYGDIARAIGSPAASRPVGAANGKNPIAIIVPCHRIIGSSGALVGYAGGLPRKKWLLAHESRLAERSGARRGNGELEGRSPSNENATCAGTPR